MVTDAAGHTTNYVYDPFDRLVRPVDPVGNVVSATYDVRGRKTASHDPDLGAWTYQYDAASELVSQTDAKGQTTTVTYDQLGRMTQRIEPDLTSTWTYDTLPNGRPNPYGTGKLAQATASGSAAPYGFSRTFVYDNFSRPVGAGIYVNPQLNGGNAYSFTATYDANSRLSSVTYPSGFVATYSYTSLGYAQQVSSGSQAYWTANTRDAELRLTQQTAGNNVVINQSFDPLTDRLTSIQAGNNNAVENISYTYDVLGNVRSRFDANQNVNETLSYDSLNRLVTSVTTNATLNPQLNLSKTFSYDTVGNLLNKSDVGTYLYPAAGSTLPHAVYQINGAVNSTFNYDANGNLLTGNARSYSWFSFNKPNLISQPSANEFFLYDTEHARWWKASSILGDGTLYFDAFGAHEELQITSTTGTWYDYISVGGAMVAMRVSGATSATRYFHADNLGSIAVITDETGVVQPGFRQGYDAWGQRRLANGSDGDPGPSQTTRGFTGQEELSDLGLVHLNGRIYDPLIARMTSADPIVPDPMNGQAWNRYSYVVNNPLVYTDPSGYCFLGLCGGMGSFLRHISVPGLAGTVTETAAVLLASELSCGPAAVVCAAAAAFISTTAVAGTSAGNLARGLKPGLIAAAEAVAYYEVGNLTDLIQNAQIGSHASIDFTKDTGVQAYAFNVTAHAAVGCAAAVASGGKCGPAALAGGVTSAAGPLINGKGLLVSSPIRHSGVALLFSVVGSLKTARPLQHLDTSSMLTRELSMIDCATKLSMCSDCRAGQWQPRFPCI